MAAEAATSRHHHHHHHQQQRQNLQPSQHLKSAVLDGLKQLFLIRRKDPMVPTDEETVAPPNHDHDQNLPPPYRLIKFCWDSNESRDACQKSKEALNVMAEPAQSHPEIRLGAGACHFHGIGKTTFVSTLLNSIYKRMPFRRRHKRRISSFRTRARGIKVRTTHPPCIPSMRIKLRDIRIPPGTQADPIERIAVGAIEREGIRLSLWDIPGQQQFPAFHDCMFPDMPSLWVFVWSPVLSENSDRGPMKTISDFQASFRYWLRFLASKRRQSNTTLKVMVVFTRADQMVSVSSSLSACIHLLRSDFLGVVDIADPPFEVDARQEDSVKPVAEHLFKVAREMLQGVKQYSVCAEVSRQLSKHLKRTNERIITWSKFTEICKMCKPSSLNDSVNLNTIASALSELGSIIYTNKTTVIIIDPNWFYNHIIASLVRFTKSEPSEDTLVFNNGCVAQEFLEDNLGSTIGFKVEGSLVLRLMEAMHLCCKVGIDHASAYESNVDLIFIPAILPNVGVHHLQWDSPCNLDDNDDNDTFVYRGRRLECENKVLTFLTPGIFPRIQILFNNAFQSNANIMLGKDSISIRFADKEIIVVLCQSKSNYVIDVLVRAVNNTENLEDMPRTLAYVEKHIINSLITILAQPTGIQGVKLIESVIRPECLRDPSRAQDRENECMKIHYLKQQLRQKLEQGEPEFYDWKWNTNIMPGHQTNYDLIHLLGFENYWEVLISCKAWLELVSGDGLLRNDEDNVLEQPQRHRNLTITSLENNLAQERQILEDAIEVVCSKFVVKVESEDAIEVQSSQFIGQAISNLHIKEDATNSRILEVEKRLSKIYENFQCVRKDVMTIIKKSIDTLLKFPMENENENEKQLPRFAILTTNGDNGIANLVTSLSGVTSVRIQLYCEDHILPHPVPNQAGITLTSWSKSQSEYLSKALPYINGFFYVLSVAIIMGIEKSVDPLPNSFIPDWSSHRELAKKYPLLSSTIDSIKDISTSSTMSSQCPTMMECFNEWQKWLASVLVENGGLTDQNIAEKFCLRRTIYDDKTGGSSQVAWLCDAHHQMRPRKDAQAASFQPHNRQKLPSAHRLINMIWTRYEVIEACEKSSAALDSLKPLSITLEATNAYPEFSSKKLSSTFEATNAYHKLGQQLFHLTNVENLFLISNKNKLRDVRFGGYGSYADLNDKEERAWEWGSRDMMLDLDDMPTAERKAILTAAANLTGRAVHLLMGFDSLTEEEERVWVEALSLAADRHAGPSSLLIDGIEFRDAHGLLSALKKNKRLQHLYLQGMDISDECVEVLRDFSSLASLHLHNVKVSKEFVVKLADLHPSHSPLAASLQRLHLRDFAIDWRMSTGFLRNWPQLKELSLCGESLMTEKDLMDFMDSLVGPPTKGPKTFLISSSPQLYNLQLGYMEDKELSRSATDAVVDALSRSGLPFFEVHSWNSYRRSYRSMLSSVEPGGFSLHRNHRIQKQLWWNQRNLISERSPNDT